ncbi:MAG: 4Fe-4S binding protein [Desulfobacterales bacterium]|nr:4Fe-4S binding protein [Desulfobacterales bacterium]MDD4071292.1 4Fe-4S binding protein [Desulfobacterales bacterium]MDD4393315.1 4Fe-4S binding protein [Desulfobacterales bacterium]
MNVSSVKLVYFSPTGTTKKILEEIASALKIDTIDIVDGTKPATRTGNPQPFHDELIILGAPVYGGRLPSDAADWFKSFTALKTPVVLIVVYGNNAYKDALKELQDIADAAGFIPVAAGAFIGEHSFSTDEQPIARDRPDAMDVLNAREFGERIRNKLFQNKSFDTMGPLNIPGNFPYKQSPSFPNIAPVTDAGKCSRCGACVNVCPAGAINKDDMADTDPEKCILCCACIKCCPNGAREFKDGFISTITNKLYHGCRERKEPETYL